MKELEYIENEAAGCYQAAQKMKWEHELYAKSKRAENYTGYFNRVIQMLYKSERLNEAVRRLSFEAVREGKHRRAVEETITETHEVFIRKSDYGYEIHLPLLLPHRKDIRASYVEGVVMSAVRQFMTEHGPVEQLEDAVVCFEHIYDRKRPVGKVRDHDNIEKKRVLDVLKMHFFKTDSGLCLDIYDCSRFGEKDETVVTIMAKTNFPAFVQREKMAEKNGGKSGKKQE